MSDPMRRPRRRPSRAVRRRRAIVVAAGLGIFAVALTVTIAVALTPPSPPAAAPTASRPPAPETPTAAPTTPSGFDASARSIDDPSSIWVVVNKTRPMNPIDHRPTDLRSPDVPYGAYEQREEAATAVEQMFAAFLAETGQEMESVSGFRDYDSQVRTYEGWVESLGQAEADRVSARPGYSEHQTGLAIDIASVPAYCSLEECFAETEQARWAAANAYRFGFVLRYPADKTEVTGYAYEPWHFRYVGVELATEMRNSGITTLEEFFGLPAAPDYLP